MFNFIYPYIPAYAADDDDSDELKGGPLFEPPFPLTTSPPKVLSPSFL